MYNEKMGNDGAGKNIIVGIDEVGRGPLAGDVAVCAVAYEKRRERMIRAALSDVRDSKKMTPRARERAAARARELAGEGALSFFVAFVSAKVIDRIGISRAISLALGRALRRVSPDPESFVFLDGGLRAPRKYGNTETVVGGDARVFSIALASVIAKTARDEKMRRAGRMFPAYGFEKHKGYGTEAHRAAIRAHGPCPLHRRTFLRGILPKRKKQMRLSFPAGKECNRAASILELDARED